MSFLLAALRAPAPLPTSRALSAALALRRRGFARVSASELRAGDCVELPPDGAVYRVEAQHFQRMGMGRAYKQVTLRAVRSGLKKEVRFRTDEDVEQVALDRPQPLQVLYVDAAAATIALMDPATFEQVELPLALLGEQAPYAQEGMTLLMQSYQGQPASATLPPKVVLEVAEVTPLPGGSAKESRDIPAVCTNGVRVKVPKFTKVGDRILVDTRPETLGEYLGKAGDENA
jgi:elongation factor P